MLANNVSMNAANNGAINLGGDGSSFKPITEPTNNAIDKTNLLLPMTLPFPK